MNLTEEPKTVAWPTTHYVFVEKVGPFQTNAPAAWQNLHTYVPQIAQHNQITGYMSLYKMGPQVYRAGVSLAAPPKGLPEGLGYTEFSGGKFSRFVLTGPIPTWEKQRAGWLRLSPRPGCRFGTTISSRTTSTIRERRLKNS
jgi:hypothetical protein